MKAFKLVVCAVLPTAWRAPEDFIEQFVRALFAEGNKLGNVETHVILSIEIVGRADWRIFEHLQKDCPNFHLLAHNTASTKNADLYLAAFRLALDLGPDLVLEIDASGAHEAEEVSGLLSESVAKLQTDPQIMLCVMSTRMDLGGADHFPWDRVSLSLAGTVFARNLLMLGPQGSRLTDLTSGFEAFSAPLLRKMFELCPPEKWISTKWGPMHLFQTEARALICWLAKHNDVTILEKGIIYGAHFNRKLAPLTAGYLARALIGGMLLIWKGVVLNLKLAKSRS